MKVILYSEVNILCIMFLALIYFKMKMGMALQLRQRLFRAVLISNCIFFTLDILWIFIDAQGLDSGIPANWAVNVLYCIFAGIVSYSWFLYSETVQQSKLVQSGKKMLLCAVPIMILAVLVLASVKFNLIFYIDEANKYNRGPLYMLQLLLSWGYVLFTAIKAMVRSRRADSYIAKMEFRTLASFVIAPVFFAVVQFFLPGISLVCIGTTFGCLYVFITMQEQMISLDALTGINNRNKLMQYLSDRVAHTDRNTRLFLVMMDLDCFKSINDEYGHVEGDNALCIVADALKMCCNDKYYFIARYGGDEFSAVCELEKNERIEDFQKNIVDTIEDKSKGCPYKLSISIGWKEYNSDISSEEEFFKQADAELYKAKQLRKSSNFQQ